VMAFSDEMIRALVRTAAYTDPRDERHLSDTLILRRDKIGAAYLGVVTPLVDFALSADGRLSFANAAEAAGVSPAPRGGYRIDWAYFDNSTAAISPIGETTSAPGGQAMAPALLRDQPGSLVRARVTPIDPPVAEWRPVDAYFRRAADRWTLVGLDRGGVLAQK
jgi:hypothetical protein